MEKVFSIVENIKNNTVIIISVYFIEKYNISIGKDDNTITIYFFNTKDNDILKMSGNSNKLEIMKKIILDKIGDIPLDFISGVSSIDNLDELSKNFIISSEHNYLIEIYKKF